MGSSTKWSSPMQTLHKYSGAGNTFLIVDDRDENFPLEMVPSLCSSETDGLILWRNSLRADAEMVYFNRDGSSARMCGNGLRCFVHFLHDVGHSPHPRLIEICDQLLKVTGVFPNVWIHLPTPKVLFWELKLSGHTLFVVDTGVPHAVVFAKDPINVVQEGRKLRWDPYFGSAGVNVNFVWVDTPQKLRVRTYERGVEDETGACGTGSCAAAFVAHELGLSASRTQIQVRSGELLEVDLTQEVLLSGPTKKLAELKCTSFRKEI